VRLKLAILSDMHVGFDRASTGGWLTASDNRALTGEDLIGGLRHIVDLEGLTADVLICPGDLTDKANPHGLIRAWDLLQQIRTYLSADFVIAATGNHDTDSHSLFVPGEPWHTARTLYPPFPIGNDDFETVNDQYWSRGWCLMSHDGVRILNVNSSHNHLNAELAKRGHIADSVIHDIIRALSAIQEPALNILVTHHHPIKVGIINSTDQSHMVGGEVLLEKLAGTNIGPWLVIHGHKHVPRVDYFMSGAMSLPIFAAGSFSAKLWDEAAPLAKNQFYLLEITALEGANGLENVSGICNSWSWVPNSGWKKSGSSGGIMSGSGFGWRQPHAECVQSIVAAFDSTSRPWIDRSELIAIEPRYENLTTEQQIDVHTALRALDFKLVVDDDLLVEVGRVQ
jgi:3',5'-cyclic AMP phosphodiesterase CpdA